MHRTACLLALLLLIPFAVPGVRLDGAQPAGAGSRAAVNLSQTEAARLARTERERVRVDLPPGLELSLWAPEKLIVDPVAIDIDPRGTLYVTSTARNNMPLDIRGHQDWMALVHTLRTVDDLRDFYRKEMAPERSDKNPLDPGSEQRRLARHPRPQRVEGARVSDRAIPTATASPTSRRSSPRDSTRIRPWTSSAACSTTTATSSSACRRACIGCATANGDGVLDQRTTIGEGFNTHPAFGGHGVSGVTIGPDGRLYWEVGDIGLHVVDKAGKTWSVSQPGRGGAIRDRRLGLRGVRHRHSATCRSSRSTIAAT